MLREKETTTVCFLEARGGVPTGRFPAFTERTDQDEPIETHARRFRLRRRKKIPARAGLRESGNANPAARAGKDSSVGRQSAYFRECSTRFKYPLKYPNAIFRTNFRHTLVTL